MRPKKLSGLQRDGEYVGVCLVLELTNLVLKLYRQCIRQVYLKPIESQPNFRQFVRSNFERYAAVERKDFGAIEHLLRKGNRMLEVYSNPGVRNVH